MRIEDKSLKTLLIDLGIASRRDVERVEIDAEAAGRSLSQMLVSSGTLSADDTRKARALSLGIPFVDLSAHQFDLTALSVIPEPISRSRFVVCYSKQGSDVEVAALDLESLEELGFLAHSGLRALPRLTDERSIKAALREYQNGLKREFGDIIREEAASLGASVSGGSAEKNLAESAQAARIVDTIFRHAAVQSASSIRLERIAGELVVRYRIHGLLLDAMTLPGNISDAVIGRLKALAGIRPQARQTFQEGRFAVEMNGEKTHVRATFVPTIAGDTATLSIERDGGRGRSLREIGFHGHGLDAAHSSVRAAAGLTLISGPEGSGKSEVFAALASEASSPHVAVATVEDDPAGVIPLASRIRTDDGMGFGAAAALRAALRQDPDVLAIDEISSVDGAEAASSATIAAALGKRVIATIKSPSAAESIRGLIDIGVDRARLASALRCAISVRLARRIKSAAAHDRRPLSKAELAALAKAVDLDRVLAVLRAGRVIGPKDGWDKVRFGMAAEDGYSAESIGIQEVVPVSPALKDLIAKGASAKALEAEARKEGSLSLIEDGVYKAALGLTTIEEVLRVLAE